MPSVEKLRAKLVDKLKELFQLDQPELDFGFYRIMHAKAQQVMEFLENDLLGHIRDAFGSLDDKRRAELDDALRKAIEQAKAFGADPDKAPPVLEAKAKLDAFQNGLTREGEVYDHLFRFFERYYEDGDFISRRYYARETEGRAAPYAIPYNGEEVKLVWANMDQYYIKSSEYFTNYSFDLRAATAKVREDTLKKASKVKPGEVRASLVEASPQGKGEQAPLRVHFKIVSGSEGEHGNVKASDANKRFFILHKDAPVGLNAAGELEIRFEYRADPDKTGQDGTWRAHRNAEAVRIVSESLDGLEGGEAFKELLATPAPTEKQAQRTLLGKYIEQYTTRNTCDYFIHKDLGGFLKRELDFYIKNEVMRLDDITGEGVEAVKVEEYLDLVRVLRKVAGKVIEFLAQLEEYQKKLWLKKKFVVETNYCITLDRVPEGLYEEIAKNDAQREEWVRLYEIDNIDNEEGRIPYSVPLTVQFLKTNQTLPIDTSFFDTSINYAIVSQTENSNIHSHGLLVHSDNFQGLGVIENMYKGSVSCTYIDPPYNSDSSPIIYKNGYKSSSWCSLIYDRVALSASSLKETGVFVGAIDDVQQKELGFIVSNIFRENNLGVICVRSNPSGRPTQTGYSVSHEWLIYAGKSDRSIIGRLPPTPKQLSRFTERDEEGRFEWRNLRREGSDSDRAARPKLYYPIFIHEDKVRIPKMLYDENSQSWTLQEAAGPHEKIVYPDTPEGKQKRWRWGHNTVTNKMSQISVRKDTTGNDYIYYKRRPNEAGVVCISSWFDSKFSATEHGTGLLKEIFNEYDFSYPKSIYAVMESIYIGGASLPKSIVLDYFAGSGTTGHAVINLNREDGGNRKYILVEMGDHFDTVLIPRLKKVIYSKDWKDGKPLSRDTGISHCFKYIRLESYEDCLNNIEFTQAPARDAALAASPSLREDYMLHYMLDVETKGSPSLLNIDLFRDPTAYALKVKKHGADEYVTKPVDLIETFNFLIGLRVSHYDMPRTFAAEFEREPDPELPTSQDTKLSVKGWAEDAGGLVKTKGTFREVQDGKWWFRKLEGWVPADRSNPDGARENVLVIWRKLTGDLEQDNLMLDCWFQAMRMNPRDSEFNTIYVNGSHNLPNLKRDGDTWKVRLIEEDFHRLMWDVQDV